MLQSNKPTDEQAAILDLARLTDNNLVLNAFAGCGKTTTLEMVTNVVKQKPILYLVFNKKNAEEAETRMPPSTTVRTFNGMGHRVWTKVVGSSLGKPETKKSQIILRELINGEPKAAQPEIWESFWEIIAGVALAKAIGYIPEGKFPNANRLIDQQSFHLRLEERPSDLTSDFIDSVLLESIRQSYKGYIDYNDQIYMPALFEGSFPKFPLVLVDETQDLNPTNHAMVDKLVRGRVMAVGDPFQSIYGFRGAVQGGMGTLAEKFKMQGADLSVSFRCPRAIVENARWRVPQFKWMKEGGHVERLSDLAINSIPDGAAVLSRNNAPLFRLALRLLSNKRSVSVAGSDIGPKIVALMRKLGPDSMLKASVMSAVDGWLAERLAKESKTAEDMAACMKVFAEFGSTLGQAISYAEHLFGQKGTIRLLTGHKAKGLEFDTVFHLDPWLIGDDEQELNLKYVIQTRSANRYYEIDGAKITA